MTRGARVGRCLSYLHDDFADADLTGIVTTGAPSMDRFYALAAALEDVLATY